jgi:hypothetical protein
MDEFQLSTNFLSRQERNEIYHYIAQKSILKLVKLQSLVAKCCKIRKICPVKLANFEYFSIARGTNNHF